MIPPLCSYAVEYSEFWHPETGQRRWAAVATIKPCGHVDHRHQDFEAKLQRFHPELHLGFDLSTGFWVIYRHTPVPVQVKTGIEEMPVIGQVHQMLDIVYTLKWVWDERTKFDGIKRRSKYREFGDWVFRRIAAWKPKQFEADGSWFGPTMRAQAQASEEADNKERDRKIRDVVDDAMTLADSGNPRFIRTAVRVGEKHWEKSAT